ncbi:uncharacterized protein G2W53_043523 [Senna tora]|uniref:Uncharacterized protein n=1 Tax=Senna tora TaxID=362788 RepID=A0A834W0A5_9FABA|nr:uncharacterized protein G2W53_043523 [Senna tora]
MNTVSYTAEIQNSSQTSYQYKDLEIQDKALTEVERFPSAVWISQYGKQEEYIKWLKQRTKRTPKAFATPANVTSECSGPTPPYMKTYKKQTSVAQLLQPQNLSGIEDRISSPTAMTDAVSMLLLCNPELFKPLLSAGSCPLAEDIFLTLPALSSLPSASKYAGLNWFEELLMDNNALGTVS